MNVTSWMRAWFRPKPAGSVPRAGSARGELPTVQMPADHPWRDGWPPGMKDMPATEQAKVRLERGRALSAYNQKRAKQMGITHYTWRWSGAGNSCDRCKVLDGKRFAWAKPPPGGHPGECACGPHGVCGCVARNEIKGFG